MSGNPRAHELNRVDPGPLRPGLPADVVSRCLGTVQLALERGNVEEAHAAIDRAFFKESAAVSRDSSLHALGLPMRLVNALEGAGVLTVEHLTRQTERTITRIGNLGPRAVAAVRMALAEHGLGLCGD